MTLLYWSEFGILFVASLLGSLAVLPYSLRLLKESSHSKPLKMSLRKLATLSFLQGAVLFAVVVGVGLLASHTILNGLVGLICGWLFWTYGIEAAMVAHFAADIIYHVGGTIVLQKKTKKE